MQIIDDNRKKYNPTAGEAYGGGWDIMWKVFIELLVVSLVFGLISGPISFFQWEMDDFHWAIFPVVFFGIAFGIFVVGPIGYSVDWVHLKAVKGRKIEIKDMFAD